MGKKLPFQCCICKAVCWNPQGADKPEVWSECDSTIAASHGICPRCLPGELEKARRAQGSGKGITLAS